MIEIGAIGSPIDAATFVAVLVLYRYETASDLDTLSAGVVALAKREPDVLDDRLVADLDVDARDVDAVMADGGERTDG